jgi:hypothetical protein
MIAVVYRDAPILGVIAGHSASEDARKRADVPAIPINRARSCHENRDGRDKPGHDYAWGTGGNSFLSGRIAI